MSRRLTVEADGGSRGNPGVAGYGALVRDSETGALLAGRAEPLGLASNNVAEYRGLIAGLEAAARIDSGATVSVRMDSKLVVEQMAGRWKIKHDDMRRLALQAQEIVRDIRGAGGSVEFTWIPREQNRDADALSNVAMDGDIVDRTFGIESEVDDALTPPAEGERARPATEFGSRGIPTRIILVRHGITDFTAEGRLDGRGGPDPDLNDIGRSQAAAAGVALAHLVGPGGAAVVTSSLARAIQPGDAVARAIGASAQVDPDWDEQNFGAWDGLSVHDLVASSPEDFLRLRDDPTYAPDGGESHEDLAARILPAWERVVAAGGTTVVVCHRKPIMVVLAHLLGTSPTHAWRLAAAPGSLTALEVWESGEVSIAFTNRT